MKFWLIAIWKTIPPGWIIGSAPFALPLFALGLWFIVAGLSADPIDLSEVAHAEELERLMPLAANGDIPAQLRVGAIQRDGLDGTVDGPAAFYWFERAARQGSVSAQYALGDMFERGLGIRRDYVRAAEWFRMAGGLGHHVEAQYAMGDLYFFGRGVAHNYDDALRWYQRAARQGQPAAQYVLGAMYERGWGVKRDAIKAYVWYKRAAKDVLRLRRNRPDANLNADLTRLKAAMTRLEIKRAKRRLKPSAASSVN